MIRNLLNLSSAARRIALLAVAFSLHATAEDGIKFSEIIKNAKITSCGKSHCFTIMTPEASRGALSGLYALATTTVVGSPLTPAANPISLAGFEGFYDPSLKIVVLRSEKTKWNELSLSLENSHIEYFYY